MTDPARSISDLAVNYRRLVLCFACQFLLNPVVAVLSDIAISAPSEWTLAPIVQLLYLAITLALVFFSYRTARAAGSSQAWVWAIAMLVPCINIITLLALSAKATAMCREQGVAVGFFGPRIP